MRKTRQRQTPDSARVWRWHYLHHLHHRAHYGTTWCHALNRMYITHWNATRGITSHKKSGKVWRRGFEDMQCVSLFTVYITARGDTFTMSWQQCMYAANNTQHVTEVLSDTLVRLGLINDTHGIITTAAYTDCYILAIKELFTGSRKKSLACQLINTWQDDICNTDAQLTDTLIYVGNFQLDGHPMLHSFDCVNCTCKV